MNCFVVFNQFYRFATIKIKLTIPRSDSAATVELLQPQGAAAKLAVKPRKPTEQSLSSFTWLGKVGVNRYIFSALMHQD